MKCPFCNGENVKKVTPPAGSDGFVIGTYTERTHEINPAGIAVDLFTCDDCHHIWMMND